LVKLRGGLADTQQVRRPLRIRALAALPLSIALLGLSAGVAEASDPLAYVANQEAGTISQVDLATGTVGTPIAVGSGPDSIAISPNGGIAYVADYDSSEVVPVQLATGATGNPIVLSDRPNAIAITPNGSTAYVISDAGREWPIKLANDQVGNPSQIPSNADAVAVSQNGVTGYITDVATGTISPLSLSNGGLGQPINIGAATPDGIALTLDGSTAWVASNSEDTITPVTLATGATGTPIPAGSEPTSLALSADRSTAYVTDFGTGQITPITLATGAAGTPISVGAQPSAIALVPPGGIISAPLPSGGGGGSNGGSGSKPSTLGNQQLSLTVSGSGSSGSSSAAQTCHAPSSTLTVRMTRKTLPHGAKLTLRYVTFTLGKQVKRATRLPATVRLPLRGLSRGSHTLTVRAFYTEKLGGGGRKRHKLTVPINKALRTRVTVC
jgi:YVTN family beta-propeller protein